MKPPCSSSSLPLLAMPILLKATTTQLGLSLLDTSLQFCTAFVLSYILPYSPTSLVYYRTLQFSLDTLETKHTVKSLNRQQLQGRLRSEPSPDWNKAPPKCWNAITFDRLDEAVNKTVIYFLIRRLIHHERTDTIPRSHGTSHEKASNKGTGKGRSGILAAPARGVHNVTLGQVVATHFGGVQDTGAQNIHFDTAVKATNTLIRVHFGYELCQGD
jgi:hypothetical protein